MKRFRLFIACLALILAWPACSFAQDEKPESLPVSPPESLIDTHIAAHANQSGVYVLDKGEEALLARAWLADHAQKSIEVQYFI